MKQILRAEIVSLFLEPNTGTGNKTKNGSRLEVRNGNVSKILLNLVSDIDLAIFILYAGLASLAKNWNFKQTKTNRNQNEAC